MSNIDMKEAVFSMCMLATMAAVLFLPGVLLGVHDMRSEWARLLLLFAMLPIVCLAMLSWMFRANYIREREIASKATGELPVAYRYGHDDCPDVWSGWLPYGNGICTETMLEHPKWHIEYAYASVPPHVERSKG